MNKYKKIQADSGLEKQIMVLRGINAQPKNPKEGCASEKQFLNRITSIKKKRFLVKACRKTDLTMAFAMQLQQENILK